MPKKARRVVYLVAAAMLVGVLGTAPAAAGPFLTGWHADSGVHTFQNPSQYWLEDWYDAIYDSRVDDFDPTDMLTETVTYHYNDDLTYPYVDVTWWTANITPPGSVGCNVPVSGSSEHCDHWHMMFDSPQSLSEAAEDYVACQEIAHSVGLDHWNDSNNIVDKVSCIATGEDAYNGSILTFHDKTHINGHY